MENKSLYGKKKVVDAEKAQVEKTIKEVSFITVEDVGEYIKQNNRPLTYLLKEKKLTISFDRDTYKLTLET